MKPDDDESWAFMMFLGREGGRPENTRGKALAGVSVVLLFFGMGLAFYGSRLWGGIANETAATLFGLIIFGAFISFTIADTEPTRKLAAAVMLAFWLGAINPTRLWWGLAGAGVLALAFAIGIIAERRTPQQDAEDDIGFRLQRWSWARAQERADNAWKVFLQRITGKQK